MAESDLEVYSKMGEIVSPPEFFMELSEESEHERKIATHRAWLRSLRRERPGTETPYKVAVYIRYFNQTKYEDYLSFHKKQFSDAIAACPKWSFKGFYVDEGSTAPNMETAPEWSRLVQNCFDGQIDLIITQKVSNVSRKMSEITLLASLMATQQHPIGIYFISEDIFTLASYYQEDLKDPFFLPGPEVTPLPDNEEVRCLSE